MYILRNVTINDLDDLYELSQLMVFINLPPDRNIIKKKIQSSIKSFKSPSEELDKNYYIFVLEDFKSKKIVGVSMIHGKHGTEDEPHFYLKVGKEQKYSKTINTGFIHGTLKLGLITDGWTEIGGLILSPELRGHPDRLGKQLSFVRFLYIGLHRNRFTDYIHSELMPPLDSKGQSPLWEAIGRRFMNMDYEDADRLSRQNKEFILSLYPSDTIYETLLPPEARFAIGKVGNETLPVKKMLESIGFHYTEEVDPFDGGPHYRAKTDEIKIVKQMQKDAKIEWVDLRGDDLDDYLVCVSNTPENFLAIKVRGKKSKTALTLPSSQKEEYAEFFKSETVSYIALS
ncbi:MAG: arginine N-succinyltransferase [Bdellovibrio sp.]